MPLLYCCKCGISHDSDSGAISPIICAATGKSHKLVLFAPSASVVPLSSPPSEPAASVVFRAPASEIIQISEGKWKGALESLLKFGQGHRVSHKEEEHSFIKLRKPDGTHNYYKMECAAHLSHKRNCKEIIEVHADGTATITIKPHSETQQHSHAHKSRCKRDFTSVAEDKHDGRHPGICSSYDWFAETRNIKRSGDVTGFWTF